MSVVKRPKTLADIIAELKRDQKIALTSRRIPDDVKLNFIRTISEAGSGADTIVEGVRQSISESGSGADSITTLTCTSFGIGVATPPKCDFKIAFASIGM